MELRAYENDTQVDIDFARLIEMSGLCCEV